MGHALITPLHLLASLLRQEGGLVGPLLEKIGVPQDRIKSIVDSELSRLPSQSNQAGMGMEASLNGVLNKAEQEARDLKDEYTSVEHLLLGLCRRRARPRRCSRRWAWTGTKSSRRCARSAAASA